MGDDAADGHAARAALRRDTELAAPDLVDVETVAVLRKRWLAKTLTARRFRSAIADLADLPIIRYPTLALMDRAYELRANITPYDAAYVALAESSRVPPTDRRPPPGQRPGSSLRVPTRRRRVIHRPARTTTTSSPSTQKGTIAELPDSAAECSRCLATSDATTRSGHRPHEPLAQKAPAGARNSDGGVDQGSYPPIHSAAQ